MSVKLAIANIALDTASVSRQGFGTLLFVGKHNYFPERIKAYTSVTSMVADGIPTTSGVYAAAQAAFSQNPSPTSIKIGRQESTSVLAPTGIADGVEFKITIAAKDAVTAEFVYAAGAADDAEAIVDALKTAIDADTDIAAKVTTTKVGAGADAVLELSQTATGVDWFTVSSLLNLTETFKEVSTETAADTINAISLIDDAWYYFSAEDHTEAFIVSAAATLEAKLKFYRFSTAVVGSYASTPTGPLALVQTSNYFRTSGMYHHEADTKFPEVAAIAEIAFAVTGTVTYANRIVAGVSPSLNGDGNTLTTTQQNNLKTVNGDFFARVGSFSTDPVIIVVGKTASGEWIDNIVGRDNMEVDMEADFTNFFIRQKASKAAFNNKGANQLRSVLRSVLNLYTVEGTHNFIEKDFEIIIPDQSAFNSADKASRTFTQITFKAKLTNAIHMVEITGTLSL
jgi:hypothetical protein